MKRTLIKITKQEHPIVNNGLTYPEADDIYAKSTLQQDIDPENITALKEPNEKRKLNNEKSFEEDVSGSDLDVPGSEADDTGEFVGSEDEENNYYSVGGDNHNNLEEDDFPE
ncbi:MAG: hypothetical protein MUE72_01160 [Chitinophagaceae bacterium]|jgi:hypothetical protein|nr:hypothetical protein [Chitinophagaceae bacterium]